MTCWLTAAQQLSIVLGEMQSGARVATTTAGVVALPK